MKRKSLNAILSLPLVLSIAFILNSCGGVKDSDIETAISQKVSSMSELAGITASVKDGVVTLTGECKDEASKKLCEETVKAIKGVKSVVDNTTVAPPPPPPAPVVIAADDPLKASVAEAIKSYTTVKADVKDGVVTLTGEIKKADLTKLMQALNGLKPKKIENQLTVKK